MEWDRRAGGIWCAQPLATRGDWEGRSPSRGKGGGAAEKTAEKQGLAQREPSGSVGGFFFLFFLFWYSGDERTKAMEAVGDGREGDEGRGPGWRELGFCSRVKRGFRVVCR